MSPEVRVNLRLGSIRLEFTGDQSFYEKHVERLVAAAARDGRLPAPRPTPPEAPEAKNGEAVAPAAAPKASPVPSPPAAAASGDAWKGFVPQSGEFGRYVRRLGPEANEPERQVVAMAFYLWNYEKRETFGEDDIQGCFRALRLPVPVGLPSMLEDLTERLRFVEKADGRWRLSRKGENYVKTRLLVA